MKIRFLPFVNPSVNPYSSIVFSHISWGFKICLSSFTGEIKYVRLGYLWPNGQRQKVYLENILKKDSKQREVENYIIFKKVLQKPGVVKTAVGSEFSMVSGNYYENKVSVVMEMASFCLFASKSAMFLRTLPWLNNLVPRVCLFAGYVHSKKSFSYFKKKKLILRNF
jgi:hypothetical protein